MKKYFFSFLLSVSVLLAEQKALIVSEGGLGSTGSGELNTYLKNGWKIFSITPGSGSDSISSCWLVILEK